MTESEWSNIKPHTIEGNYQRPDYEEILRTKAYIDERSRREWREQYGEMHEEYVTVQTQVFVDDAGDLTIVMPRYHPPGVASSSTYSGVIPPTSIPNPGLPMVSMTAAHRVYQDDDVFRVLARHCDKPSLVRLMSIEQTGTIFDTCVKELYREVDYDDIKSMLRDTPRRSQYLDAVIHVKSDPPRHEKKFALFPVTSIDMADNAEPCSPTAISFLRLKCPNLGVVTRHVTYRMGQRLTIILSKGKRTGTVRIHEQADLLPFTPDHQFVDPIIQIPAIWQGWIIKHTVGLGLFGSGEIVHQWDGEIKAVLQDPNRLDRRITQIQTGWLPFNLSELGAIAASRFPDKNPISRISSTVAPFKARELELFLKVAGKSLYQLHLHTRPHPGFITPYDLSFIVEMVRRDAPNLVDRRLPMLFTNRGRMFVDDYIEFPPVSGPGTVRTLWILAYDLGELGEERNSSLRTVCSWNFARNLACLLAPDFEIRLTAGPTTIEGNNSLVHTHTGMPFISWVIWQPQLKAAIKFFQRLGPNLKRHLAEAEMTNLGVFSVENIEDLTYTTNGEPLYVEPTTTWSYGKKRTWENYCYGDDPDYWEQADMEDEAHQESLDQLKREEREKEIGEAQQKHLGTVDKVDPIPHAADVLPERNVLEFHDEGPA